MIILYPQNLNFDIVQKPNSLNDFWSGGGCMHVILVLNNSCCAPNPLLQRSNTGFSPLPQKILDLHLKNIRLLQLILMQWYINTVIISIQGSHLETALLKIALWWSYDFKKHCREWSQLLLKVCGKTWSAP